MLITSMKHSFADWPDRSAKFGSLVLFFQGCDYSCSGCQNPSLRPHSNEETDCNLLLEEIDFVGRKLPSKRYGHIVLTGGDPLSKKNRDSTIPFIWLLRDAGYRVAIYTGSPLRVVETMLPLPCDYVKCEPFIPTKRQNSGHIGGCFYLASTNQIIIDGNGNVLTTDGKYCYL